MTQKMHREIYELKNDVMELGNLALAMLEDSMKALVKQDVELARITEKKKHNIRKLDTDIEANALRIIALHQPMATDLRTLATILKLITYLTRLGRYGKDIASIVEEISNKPYPASFVNLKHMWEHVNTLVTDALKAFKNSDIKYIKGFKERDDEVDEMRWSIFRECITYMIEDPKLITICAHFMMIARYLERCGDHACKIAEKVHYMVTGEHIEIS